MQIKREMKPFNAVDEQGGNQRLVANTETPIDDSTGRPVEGPPHTVIKTADGRDVLRMAPGKYQVAATDEILTSSDPRQPPWPVNEEE